MPTMNEQQKYLLNRIPGQYAYKNPTLAEPADIKRARKIIAAYEDKTQKEFSSRKKKYLKAIRNAREAVYFKKPEQALEIIKSLEQEFTPEED